MLGVVVLQFVVVVVVEMVIGQAYPVILSVTYVTHIAPLAGTPP